MDVYRSAGLSEDFIQRIENTSPKDMWYPTRDELIASNVVTRQSLGGEAATLGMIMNSRTDYLLTMKSIPLVQAYEKRFPGITTKVVEQGWSVKEKGGNDSEIQFAVRSLFSEAFTRVIQTSDDSTLDDYARLLINELMAARSISNVACVKLLNGNLDILRLFLIKYLSKSRTSLWEHYKNPQGATRRRLIPQKWNRH